MRQVGQLQLQRVPGQHIRQGLRRIIEATGDLDIVRDIGDAGECLYGCAANNCSAEILLWDFSLSGPAGIDVLAELRAKHPHLSVLALSLHPQARWAERALRAGAAGYITIGSAPVRLIEAIRAIASGNQYLNGEPSK